MLLTKLHIPSTGKNLVHRSSLFEKLNEGVKRKLIVISAPAGSGKTTLLSDWISQFKISTAWYSIDKRDNDPVEFLSIVIAGIQTINKDVGKSSLELLESQQSINTEYIVELLINDILTVERDFILVLDDFHLISSNEIFKIVTYILDNLPQQLHIAISTRSDPPLPIARLRSRNELIEIRSSDLNFTVNDISAFFNKKLKLGLSIDDLYLLEAKTEGWIAGLQLTALSMQGRTNMSAYIRMIAGGNRYIMDYLIEEVLHVQSDEIKEFLLNTSVLNKLSGPLCDAVLQRNNSQLLLESLEKNNMFIVPLDNERKWFRYHHLFADLLRKQLFQTQSEIISETHRQASKWYEQNYLEDEAVDHALAAKDFERVVNLIMKQADTIWKRGDHAKFRLWFEDLPNDLILSKPQLSILNAESLLTQWMIDPAEQSLQVAEQALNTNIQQNTGTSVTERDQLSHSDKMMLRGRVAANRALIASYREDVPGIIKHSNRALECLPEEELTWRSTVAITLGDANYIKGDLITANRLQLEALEICKESGNPFLLLITNANLAVTLRQQGQLKQTLEICQQQVLLARKNMMSQTVVVGWFLAIMGEVLAELNDLEEAINHARKGVEITKRCGDVAMLCKSYLCLIRILYSIGNMAVAEENIQILKNISRESYVTTNIKSMIEAWQARIWLAQDKLDVASEWVHNRKLDMHEEKLVLHEDENKVVARIYLSQYQFDEASKLLNHMIKEAETGGRINSMVEMLVIQALVLKNQGNTNEAIVTLEKALSMAEPFGFIRIFVDEGPPLVDLLTEILDSKTNVSQVYVKKLLSAISLSKLIKKDDPMIDPLSNRELDTLKLIAENLSNQEIADKLFISLNTVKTHVRNILEKLYVANRSSAVIKAKELGII
jgi:LuxR family maltose regulon positive regulatory protein